MFQPFDSFFLYGPIPFNAEQNGYDLPLVVLSYLVASIASYTALSMAQQLVNAGTVREKRLFHWGGAFAMGAGIWSMHFIGMLSYKMRMVVKYDTFLTLISMLIAIAVAYGVLGIVSRKRMSLSSLLLGGVLLGFGIAAMHYTGMAAMKMDGDLRYIPGLFFFSGLIAVAASAAALWISFNLARHNSRYNYLLQIGAALVMGAAICGMHYMGMVAAVFIPYADCRFDPNQSFDVLALAVAGTTGLVLASALATGFYRKAQIELRLQTSETKLRAMMDHALDGVIAMDQEGRVTEWNKQAESLFGWTHDEAIGRLFSDMITPSDQYAAHLDNLQDFLGGKDESILNKRVEILGLTKEGVEFPIELALTFYKVKDQHQFTGFIRDISSRKKGERDQALLAAIVKSSDDAIISKTLNGKITSWNAAAEKLFGYTAEEALGRDIIMVIPDDRREEEPRIISTLAQGRGLDHFETVRRTKAGDLIDVSLTISPVFDSGGRVIGASKIARDITDLKKSQAVLEDMSRKKDEFLANMSHELRTPMNVVIGLANLLGMTHPLTDKQREFISTLKLSADSLLALINDLLDFARIEQGAVECETIEFNLKESLEKVISLMNVKAREKNLELRFSYAPGLKASYIGDPLRLNQILTNIIGNAIKFTNRGYVSVDVNAEEIVRDNKMLVIKVRDTGIGISKDKQALIFDKFSQADASITRKYGGSGLGLAICKTLVTKMGGFLSVESQTGAGSTFTVKIPVLEKGGSAALEKPRRTAPVPSSQKKEKVLVVEDYAPNMFMITAMLDQLGYYYETAHNGVEALNKFAETRYDVILMDMQMPEMDGMEATRRIRQAEQEKNLARTPIFAVTAHVLKGSRDAYAKAGIDDMISKPFDPAELTRKLASLESYVPLQKASSAT